MLWKKYTKFLDLDLNALKVFFFNFFIKALYNKKVDIYKCPIFKKITKFYFLKKCTFS